MANTARESFFVLHEFIKRAEQSLSPQLWDYLRGASESETTLLRNRAAIDAWTFRPRVLRDVESVELEREVLGLRLSAPLILAPIGGLQSFDPAGGAAMARAAQRFGVVHMQSSVAHPALEALAEEAPGPRLYQLYVRGDADWVDGHVRRAMAAGYRAFCFTVDLDYYSKRERDIAKRYVTPARRGASNEVFQKRFNWDDIARVRDRFDIPIVLKGIATAEDADIACEHGVHAVYVSNHGGRQLDHGRGSLDVLPEVVAAVGQRAEVIVDGGFMRGSDVVKAIIMGATAVGLGRLGGCALAAGGEDGVIRMLEILTDEIRSTLGMLGVKSWQELDSTYLHRSVPARRAGVFSAFPLLDEGY